MSSETITKNDLKAILENMNSVQFGEPKFASWRDVVPTASVQNNCGSIPLDKDTAYLILARNGNGMGASQICNINFAASNANIISNWNNGFAQTASGSGNSVTAWCYVENGSDTNTLNIQSYGYNTSARFSGIAIAIPITKSTIFGHLQLAVSESEALYTAINNLGWTSDVIV